LKSKPNKKLVLLVSCLAFSLTLSFIRLYDVISQKTELYTHTHTHIQYFCIDDDDDDDIHSPTSRVNNNDNIKIYCYQEKFWSIYQLICGIVLELS
jgi:hypothetical protein